MLPNLVNNKIHVISFAIPYPANYGGVQDVFHKLRWLNKAGVKVHLHAWAYNGRTNSDNLAAICDQVSIYERVNHWPDFLSGLPYTVSSRQSTDLLKSLQQDNDPILFESLHTTRWISHPALTERSLLFRESNIEHDYYRQLALHETSFAKRIYLQEEARRLAKWEQQLHAAKIFLNVSKQDEAYFRNEFAHAKHVWIPSFTPYDELSVGAGGGDFALYHGNLSVQENAVTAFHLVELWKKHNNLPPLVIAGLNPSKRLIASQTTHTRIIPNPSDFDLDNLIASAGWHLLFTPQATGVKLKLLNVLFKGGRILANPNMLHGTGLEQAVTKVETLSLLPEILLNVSPRVSSAEWESRKAIATPFFNSAKINKLLSHLFSS